MPYMGQHDVIRSWAVWPYMELGGMPYKGQHDLMWSWAVWLIRGSMTLYGVGQFLIWSWAVWPYMGLGGMAFRGVGVVGPPCWWDVWSPIALGCLAFHGVRRCGVAWCQDVRPHML